jgi:hypothetical protein
MRTSDLTIAEQIEHAVFGLKSTTDLLELHDRMLRASDAAVFHGLFPTATNLRSYFWPVAVALLVVVEPRCPLTCAAALRRIAVSRWQVSDQLIPFYLVTQFGKQQLLATTRTVSAEYEGERRACVKVVRYWISRPCIFTRDVCRVDLLERTEIRRPSVPILTGNRREPW